MARNCDFWVEKGSKYYCLLKENKKDDGEISDQTFKLYCKSNNSKLCPIFEHYYKERK